MSRKPGCLLIMSLSVASAPAISLAGISGNALWFDGNDTVKIPYSSDFDGLNAATIEFWIKYDSPDNGGYIIDQFGAAPVNTGEWAMITRNTKIVFYFRWPGETYARSEASITGGTWHHVAMAKHNGNFDLYIDGELDVHKSLGSSHILNAHLPMYLGSRGNFEQYFEGTLDEVRIWDYKRSPEEIGNTWNRTVDPASPGLRAYWNFDEELTDQNVFDSSPLGNNGTLGESTSIFTDDPLRLPSTAPIVPEPSTGLLLAIGSVVLSNRHSSRKRKGGTACCGVRC